MEPVILKVEPTTVERGAKVNVAVTGEGIGEWFIGVASDAGSTISSPTPIEQFGEPAGSGGGRVTYLLSYSTVGYEYGEYRVTVSPKSDLRARGTRVRKFTVEASMPEFYSLGPANRDRFGLMGRRV